ncbi:cupin domain-containing protein [Pedobacter sp. HMF7647]|uniref:Cupin domain-containing protein n=2 Tax=Hufsiella arboris TaxID=2695275 RepID=A0A7K1YE63_9SPHI|nr:cupin domain-containing protein [Hufsiella arboris]
MENPDNKLTVVSASEGKSLSVAGNTYRIIISGKQTGGAYAIVDMLVPPNGGPGPHSHAGFQEAFYVVDGEVEVRLEGEKITAIKGSFVNIPLGGLIHQFKNKSDTLAHMLCIITPAGMEEMFEEIGVPVENETFLSPPKTMSEEDMEKLKSIGEKYGQKFFPPDYFDS